MSRVREGILFADEFFPRDCLRTVKELGEGFGVEFSCDYIHPLGTAKPYITTCYCGYVALEIDSAVYCFKALIAESVDFLADKPFESEKAGGDIFKKFHFCFSFRCCDYSLSRSCSYTLSYSSLSLTVLRESALASAKAPATTAYITVKIVLITTTLIGWGALLPSAKKQR